MADEKLTFRIGSVFSGEGFDRANAAVATTAKQTKRAVDSMRGLTAGMQSIDGAAGKMVGTMSGVVGSFAALGIAGGSIALAQAATDALYKSWKSLHDELAMIAELQAKVAQGAAAAMWAQHLQTVSESLKDVTTNAAAAAREFDAMSAAAFQVQSATNATASAKGQTSLSQMQWAKMIDVMSTDDPDAKRLKEATHNLAIAREQKAQTEAQDARAMEEAESDYSNATEKAARAKARVSDIESALALAKSEEAKAVSANKDKAKEFTKARERLEAELSKANLELIAASANEAAAKERLNIAAETEEQHRIAAQIEIAKNENAVRELNKSIEAEKTAREKAAKEEAESAARQSEANALKDKADKIEDDGNARITEIDKQLKASEEVVKAITDLQKRLKGGMSADAAHSQFGGGYNYHLDENGNIVDPEDFARAQRFAERDRRDRRAQERHNANYDKRMQDLAERAENGKKLTNAEQKRLDDWRKFRGQKDGQRREEERQKKLREEKEKLQKQMADDVGEIKQKIQDVLATK